MGLVSSQIFYQVKFKENQQIVRFRKYVLGLSPFNSKLNKIAPSTKGQITYYPQE